MGGALLVALPAFRLIFGRQRPVLAGDFELPTKQGGRRSPRRGLRALRCRLGAFGVLPRTRGGGARPGARHGHLPVFAFVAAMVAGMAIYEWIS